MTSVATAAAGALLLAACASSSSGGGSSPTASGSGSGDPGLAKAQQMVTQLSATTTTYALPTQKIDISGLKGRTVFYVPLIQQIPQFADVAVSMKEALETAGLKLQVCNGQAQPSAIASCAQQAIAANAAGLITDAIPYGMAQNALDAVKAKGIPIIIADQFPPSGTTNDNSLTYVPGATDQPSQIAWWIIADSGGKANAILAEESDSPSSKQYVQDSLQIYKDNCPACVITVKEITATTDALLASQVSANILATPGVNYYYTEFEDSLQATLQGVQQSGQASAISVSTAATTVNGLSLIKSGTSPMKAGVTVDAAYNAWALVDQVFRMATKSGPVDVKVPTRLFTKDNIDSITISPEAQASGSWFGDASFKSGFTGLWGIG
jgi:ribose transport system substrate-binding protein